MAVHPAAYPRAGGVVQGVGVAREHVAVDLPLQRRERHVEVQLLLRRQPSLHLPGRGRHPEVRWCRKSLSKKAVPPQYDMIEL